jgi:hypothetical protein
LTIFTLNIFCIDAQQVKYSLSGQVIAKQDLSSGEMKTVIPIPGAVVYLVSKTDSLYVTTNDGGYFSFRKVPSRYCTLSVEYLGYEKLVKEVDLGSDDLYYGLILELIEKKEKIAAAVVKDEAPVFEVIGDTLKYNVAATQKVSGDDMLRDVFERLPGISMENNIVKIMNEKVAKIYINGKLVFGDDISNPLSYLAGSEVISLKVYDQTTRDERLGLIPKGSKKERVVNVLTRTKISTAVIAQAIAGYGRNFETTGSETDNRYTAGITGNWFSEMNMLSTNVYLNNIGRSNEYSAVTDISSIPSDYKRVGYAGVRLVKKFRDPEMGDYLSADYSYGNTKSISERSTDRVYLPDENWTSRTYRQDSHTLSRSDAHNVGLMFMTINEYIPAITLSFSAADNDMVSESLMENTVDGVRGGYNQMMSDKKDEYRYSAQLLKSIRLGDSGRYGYLNYDMKLSGGYSFGNTLQRDTSLSSSSVTSFISEPQGKSLNAEINTYYSIPFLSAKWALSGIMKYKHQNESLNNLRYADAIAEANLDIMTSDIHTYNYNTYNLGVGLQSMKTKVMTNIGLYAQYDHQQREIVMPGKYTGGKNYFSLVSNATVTFIKGLTNQYRLIFTSSPILPSYEQVRADFDATNPLYISRGNPDLKKSINYDFRFTGSNMFGKSNSLNYRLQINFIGNRIVPKTTYLTENTTIDGYQMLKGSTYSTYDNVDGTMSLTSDVKWSARIKPLKLNLTGTLNYGFTRDPSYIDDQLNIAYRHTPVMMWEMAPNISPKYKIKIRSNTAFSLIKNSRYSDVSYLDQSVSVKSINNITKWMFVNGEYIYTLRHPFAGGNSRLQDHMLNAIVGFKLNKSGLEINMSCYDILNRTSTFRTSVLRNYTQTTFSPDFGRIWMVTFVWRFNSTQRSGKNISYDFSTRSLGRDYEKDKGVWRIY